MLNAVLPNCQADPENVVAVLIPYITAWVHFHVESAIMACSFEIWVCSNGGCKYSYL